eukprot:13852-Pelagococcus_subviridis.AAC.6
MAVVLVHARARARGSHVTEQQRRAYRLGERPQVSVVRRRRDGRVHRRSIIRAEAVFIHEPALLTRVPPDAAAVDVHRVVPVVVELAPGGVARALETERGGREEGREGGRGRVRERASPAHSFPVVEKGTARGGNSTRERRAGARARATSSPTHACIRR